MHHLGEALDKVRKTECSRLSGKGRRFIKGQKYNLPSRDENLTLEGKRAGRSKRLISTAYVLKEAFGHLWDYGREGWLRRFFDDWRGGLKWQRLGPYERFADMIDRHWEGIAAYCQPKFRLASSKASTTKSASSSDAPTACATIFASRFPQNHPLDSLMTHD